MLHLNNDENHRIQFRFFNILHNDEEICNAKQKLFMHEALIFN